LKQRLRALLAVLADLGEKSAGMLIAGRTHGQQAVPITFGFKVAAWSDVLLRHLDRLNELEPRLCRSMTAGAAGTFASFGPQGPELQTRVATKLGLVPMDVSARNLVDHFAELVMVLAMVGASAASFAVRVDRSRCLAGGSAFCGGGRWRGRLWG